MPTFDKVACEVCGEMVSSFPPAKARHMNEKHGMKPEVTPAPTAVESVALAPAVASTPVPAIKDAVLLRQMEIAKAQQERLLKAPNLVVAEQISDSMKELTRMYCPEATGQNATKHVYFGITAEMERICGRGYMPVIDPVKCDPVRLNELTMFWIPKAIHTARVKASQARSRAILRKAAEVSLQEKKETVKGEKPSSMGLNIEEFSVTNETVGG